MDSTEVLPSESTSMDVVENNENELNNLLGEDSGDEKHSEGDINDLLGNSDDEKQSDADINQLLGASDDEDNFDEELREKELVKEENGIARARDLDQILGRSTNIASESRAKKCGSLRIPQTFQAEEFGNSYFFRTPNFIKVQADEYVEGKYDPALEREKFGLTGTVARWRNKLSADGVSMKKESNARLIKWNDGSFQLVVGDSVFDSKIVPTDNCYVFEQQKSIIQSEKDEYNNDEERVREEACLECVGSIENRIILQPTSITSETHAKMSLKIAETFKKENKISIRDYEKITENPMITLNNIAKREEEINRRERKARQQAEYRGTSYRPSYYNNEGGADSKRPSMSANYLDDSQFEGENLSALKNKFKDKKNSKKNDREVREAAVKSRRDYDDEDGEAEEGDEDDEEDDEGDGEDEGEGESLGSEDSEDEDEDEDEDDEEEDEEEDDDEEESEEEEEEEVKKSSKHKKDKHKDKHHHKHDKHDKHDRKKKKHEKEESSKKKRSKDEVVHSRVVKDDEDEEGNDLRDVKEEEEGEPQEEVQQKKRIKRTVIDSDEDE